MKGEGARGVAPDRSRGLLSKWSLPNTSPLSWNGLTRMKTAVNSKLEAHQYHRLHKSRWNAWLCRPVAATWPRVTQQSSPTDLEDAAYAFS